MKKIIILLGLVLIILVGYFYFNNLKQKEKNLLQNDNNINETKLLSYKTSCEVFSISKTSFSFKYPEEYFINEIKPLEGDVPLGTVMEIYIQPKDGTDPIIIGPSFESCNPYGSDDDGIGLCKSIGNGYRIFSNGKSSKTSSDFKMIASTIKTVSDCEKSDKEMKEFKNDEIGFSFSYFKDYGEILINNNVKGETGKGIFGTQGCEENSKLCLFLGATTPDFVFPGELNANEVSSYPTDERLQILKDRGYKNEKKVNSQGEEYILIYGKKEIDMPYIGEGQMVAIFKLKSSTDFKAFGFMLVKGEAETFLKTINTVNVF